MRKTMSIISAVVLFTLVFAVFAGDAQRVGQMQNGSVSQAMIPGMYGPQSQAGIGGGKDPNGEGVPAVSKVIIGQSVINDVSPALRDLAPIPPEEFDQIRDMEELRGVQENETSLITDLAVQTEDGALQNWFGPLPNLMPSPITNFDGVNNINGVYPPDTNMDVGPNHIVQWVNLSFQIFNKSGVSLYGPAAGNTIWSGFGGSCQTRNDGDPIVLYDPIADRWLMSQFTTSNPYGECVAISTTNDPTGSYYRYFFQFSTTQMYDYPKFGVWPDAYYMSANRFTATFQGASAIALNRSQMLTGAPATYIEYQTSTAYGALMPSDLDGATLPPSGEPNFFTEIALGTLRIWKFHVDWVTPTNSTFTGPTNLTVSSFNQICSGTRNCIPQPGTVVGLDAIGDRLMYRLVYRNFGTHESLVVNHTVNAASSGTQAGVRWYEIRDPNGTPAIYQQSTYAPDTTHRWMGSIAMDQQGNMALGYSASSSSVYPSVRYTGRLSTDPLNSMPQGEVTLIAGSGSQTGTAYRWGDYSMMAVDPVDDCTFWYTQEYIQTTGTAPWRTRIGSFKYPSCGSVKQWVGGVSTDWNNAGNWNPSGVPTRNDNVVIDPAYKTTYWPTVNAASEAGNLTIANGAQLNATADFTLSVFSQWAQNGSGFFNASAGTVAFVGSYPVINMATPSATNHFFNLQFGNGSTSSSASLSSDLRADGNLTVNSFATLSAGAANIQVGGNFTVNVDGTFSPGTGSVTFTGATQGITTYTRQYGAWTTVRATDSFETWTPTATGAPSGWTEADTSGTAGDWERGDQTPHPTGVGVPAGGGTYSAQFNSWTSANGSATRIYTTASFSTMGYNQCQVRVWMFHDTGWSGDPDRLQVEGSTNGTTFTDSGAAISRLELPTGWREHTVDFSAFAGQATAYLSLEGISDYGNDVFIDLAAVECRTATIVTGSSTFNNLTISSSTAAAPTGNLVVNGNATVNAGGVLDLGSYGMTVEGSFANNGALRQTKTVSGATEFLHITNAAATTDKYHGVDITPAGSMGSTTVEIRGNQSSCALDPNRTFMSRCFDITPTTPQSSTVRFWFTEAERNTVDANSVRIYHFDSPPGIWNRVGTNDSYSDATFDCQSGAGTACWVQADTISGFSPFTLGYPNDPTAITLRNLRVTSSNTWLAWILALAALALVGGGSFALARSRRR